MSSSRCHSMRVRYEQHYTPMDTREVTLHRVVNIVERTTPIHSSADYDRRYDDDQWFEDFPIYPGENCPRDSEYPPDRFYNDSEYGTGFRGNSPPHHQEPHYQRPRYGRDDLRHQIRSRKNGRPGPYSNSRGRGYSQNREDHNQFRHSSNVKNEWERSSGKKKSVPPAKKNASPELDKDSSHAQSKPVDDSTPPPSVPAEDPPKTSTLIKEKPSDAVVVVEDEKEEEAAEAPAFMEPDTIQEEELRVRRSEAIKAKALEIEKHYRQDCETFVTVVKMLVSKEPTLENLLQNALNANLSEMKQDCLASFKHYIKELNEVLLEDSST
nr:periphilin-1-like [Nerophis lumbriciformis]